MDFSNMSTGIKKSDFVYTMVRSFSIQLFSFSNGLKALLVFLLLGFVLLSNYKILLSDFAFPLDPQKLQRSHVFHMDVLFC